MLPSDLIKRSAKKYSGGTDSVDQIYDPYLEGIVIKPAHVAGKSQTSHKTMVAVFRFGAAGQSLHNVG